jgi:ATP-dependent exoDNAse (exonuclease V) alpha subunit
MPPRKGALAKRLGEALREAARVIVKKRRTEREQGDRPAARLGAYSPMALGLHQEQIDALRCILFSGRNIFLSGVAGTGKSMVIRVLVEIARRHFSPPRGAGAGWKPVLVSATTGMAAEALNIEGACTAHTLLSMGCGEDGPDVCVARMDDDRALIRDTRFIVIDEISMFDSGMLRLVLDILRLVNFRGQLVVVGDLLQLGAVVKKGETLLPIVSGTAWRVANFLELQLRVNHRQRDNPRFQKFLAEVRVGGYYRNGARERKEPVPDELRAIPGYSDRDCPWSVAALRVFKEIMSRPPQTEDGLEPLWMVSHNASVKSINEHRFSGLPGPAVAFQAKNKVICTKGRLAAVGREMLASTGLPPAVTVKEGSMVMCPVNDPITGLCNGSRGRVLSCSRVEMTVKFRGRPDPITLRPSRRTFMHNGIPVAWWRGVPLIQAHAVTHHKGQGQTAAVMVEAESAWEVAQLYVALSRAPDLSMLGYNGRLPRSSLKINQELVDYDKKLSRGPSIPDVAASLNLPALPAFEQ